MLPISSWIARVSCWDWASVGFHTPSKGRCWPAQAIDSTSWLCSLGGPGKSSVGAAAAQTGSEPLLRRSPSLIGWSLLWIQPWVTSWPSKRSTSETCKCFKNSSCWFWWAGWHWCDSYLRSQGFAASAWLRQTLAGKTLSDLFLLLLFPIWYLSLLNHLEWYFWSWARESY